MRRAAGVAAVVVLVAAVGVGAFLLAHRGGGGPRGGTFTVDARSWSCATLHRAYLTASVQDATTATFVVDGAEVASGRDGGDQRGRAEIVGLLPPSVTDIDCDGRGTHRVDVVTDNPAGCRLDAREYATFTEWRNHSAENDPGGAPPGVCSLTFTY